MADEPLKMMDVWDEFSKDELKLLCAGLGIHLAILPFLRIDYLGAKPWDIQIEMPVAFAKKLEVYFSSR